MGQVQFPFIEAHNLRQNAFKNGVQATKPNVKQSGIQIKSFL